jgi:Flp pilus assembly pilin Flp
MIRFLPSSMKRVLRDRKGVSATEYVLLLVGLAAAIVGGASVLSSNLSGGLSKVGSYIGAQAALL